VPDSAGAQVGVSADRDHPLMSPAEAPRAGRREWIGLAVLSLATVLYSVDVTVLHLAVPAISADLSPSSAQLLWIVDIYGFLLAGSLITMGTLGDRIGRRRLLLVGAAAFGAASVLAAFSTSAEMLIAARALLGIAGATLLPSTLSLIRAMFLDSRQRTVAISVWITSFNVGGFLGPPLGGLLLEFFWWGSVFLMAVPVMVLLLVLGPVVLPEFRDPEARRFDLLSAGLSLAAILAATYGLKQIVQDGLGWPALSIPAGAVLGLVFVRRQQRLADPLIDLRLFRMTAFSTALVTYLFITFIGFATFLFIFQYLQLVLGLSALEAALWSMPSFAAFIVSSMLTVKLVRLMRPAYVIGSGLAVTAAGLGLLAFADQDSGLALVVIASVVATIGEAPVFTLVNDLVLGSAPPERAGAASAISETSSELGGAFGIAILGSIGTALYRHQIEDGIPEGVPPEDAAAARDTLGGAVAAGERLPEPLATELVDAGREAFIQGFQVAALTSAAIAAATAVFVVIVLRRVRTGESEEAVEVGSDRPKALAASPAPQVGC
jgi:DHA2 family multidrug resistance protein-like MFS transporter